MKNKGTTFGELLIVFFIISIALVVFLKISTDYIRTLVLAKEMFILNSLLQERYQFLIAYRNKMLERDFSTETIDQVAMPSLNFNCISFDNNVGNFQVFTLNPVNSRCLVNFLGNTPLTIEYIIRAYTTSGIYIFNIEGEIKKWKDLKSSIRGFLTPWHPSFKIGN